MTIDSQRDEAPALADLEARRRALLEHDRTLVVEAGAGSGKTALLAGRVAMMFASGILPCDVIAITFTEAAASELRDRVATYVERLARRDLPREMSIALPHGLSDQQHTAITTSLNELDAFTCTTIHGFCQMLLAPYPVEAHLDPGATIIEAARNEFVRDDLVTEWLAARFGRRTQRNKTPCATVEDDILVSLIEAEGHGYLSWLRDAAHFLCENHELNAMSAEDPLSAAQNLCEAIQDFSEWYGQCGLSEEKTSDYVRDLVELRTMLMSHDYRHLTSAHLIAFLRHEHPSCRLKSDVAFRQYRCKGNWEKAAVAAGQSKPDGQIFNLKASEKYERCGEWYRVWCERLVDTATERIVEAFTSLREAYTQYKRRIAALDFNDLLTHARDLVVGNHQVRQALALRYPRILVDEFQDTDPIQAELLWHLCAEFPQDARSWPEFSLREGSLFVVGDPKQAIYRFRGADIATYLQAKQSLCVSHSDALLEIHANFRSDARILEFVNAHFAPLLDIPGQPGYTPLVSALPCDTTRSAVVAFDIFFDDQHRNKNGKLIVAHVRQQEAESVAETIGILLNEITFPDRHTKEERKCRPGDIALLSATGTDLWVYEQKLTELGIPLASQAGKGFFQRQEVHDLIALVRALGDHRDTLAFGALLRGPLVGLSEAAIADAVMECHALDVPFTLWTASEVVSNPIVQTILIKLQYFARKARTTTPYQLLSEAIEMLDVRALVRLRDGHSGERSLANVDALLVMTKEYDVRGLAVFARALHERWLDNERFEEGRIDEQRDAVFLSTVHSSKGLEWPIVIPINSGTKPNSRSDTFLHRRSDGTVHFKVFGEAGGGFKDVSESIAEETKSETVRLWYVALTRARNMLVLPRASERIDGDRLSVLDLHLEGLETIDGIATKYRAASSRQECAQDMETWGKQSRALAQFHKTVSVHYPSRSDEKRLTVFNNDIEFIEEQELLTPSESIEVNDASGVVQGGRTRGIILHKLLEEILTGELSEGNNAILERAKILLAQLEIEAKENPCDGISLNELAQCVQRTFALPLVQEVRHRLSAEVPVFASRDTGSGISVTSGIIDAVVQAPDGSIEMLIDWKSDVHPEKAPIEHYRAQVHEYLEATNSARGLIVFLTTGATVQVHRRR